MRYIFLSYSRQDSQFAEHLRTLLEREQFHVEMDTHSIHTGRHWKRVLCRLIDRCSVFMIVMSSQSYASKWVRKEIIRAKHRGRRIFPILVDGNTPWPELANYQFELMPGTVQAKLDRRLVANLNHILCRPPKTPEERLHNAVLSFHILSRILMIVGTLILFIVGYIWSRSLIHKIQADDLLPLLVAGLIVFSCGITLLVLKRIIE